MDRFIQHHHELTSRHLQHLRDRLPGIGDPQRAVGMETVRLQIMQIEIPDLPVIVQRYALGHQRIIRNEGQRTADFRAAAAINRLDQHQQFGGIQIKQLLMLGRDLTDLNGRVHVIHRHRSEYRQGIRQPGDAGLVL